MSKRSGTVVSSGTDFSALLKQPTENPPFQSSTIAVRPQPDENWQQSSSSEDDLNGFVKAWLPVSEWAQPAPEIDLTDGKYWYRARLRRVGLDGVVCRVRQPMKPNTSWLKGRVRLGCSEVTCVIVNVIFQKNNLWDCIIWFPTASETTKSHLARLLSLNTDYLELVFRDQHESFSDEVYIFLRRDLRYFLRKLDYCLETLEHKSLHSVPGKRAAAEFFRQCDKILDQGERALLRGSGGKQRTVVQALFRKVLQPWTVGNPFIARCFEKPLGYPGDYVMMELAYAGEFLHDGGLRGIFDAYLLGTYKFLITRRQTMEKLIKSCLNQATAPVGARHKLDILSLGSGPCREWWELQNDSEAGSLYKKVRLACVDQDMNALRFEAARLKYNSLIDSTDFICGNLYTAIRSGKQLRGRSFDLIYGIGIADYFYDETLGNMVSSAFELLKPTGWLVIAHKDSRTFNFQVAEWLCDWKLIRRTKNSFVRLLKKSLAGYGEIVRIHIEKDSLSQVIFAVIRRKKR